MSDWTPLPDADQIGDELVLDDFDLIGDLTHPTRMAILHHLRSPHSAAELAKRLDMPATRLYHHLHRLEELDLIKVVATRRSGSKTERRYRMAVRGFRFEPDVGRDRLPGEVAGVLTALFDVTKHEMRREFTIGALTPQNLDQHGAFAVLGLSLRPDQRETFVERVRATIDEFTTLDDGNDDAPDVQRYRVLFAGFPITD